MATLILLIYLNGSLAMTRMEVPGMALCESLRIQLLQQLDRKLTPFAYCLSWGDEFGD